jgi:hypothetical protein
MILHRLLNRALRLLAERSHRRSAADQLLALDRRLLQDIGLGRAELLSAACFPKA